MLLWIADLHLTNASTRSSKLWKLRLAPVFEPLTDLPVEAPIDGSVSVGTASSSGSPANAGSRKASPDELAEELIDPERLLGDGSQISY